jgi:serpin B
VYHKATIEVDEMDTVAARRSNGRGHASEWKRAASGGLADRPFFFAIVDEKTSAVLFLGHVASR